MIINLPNGGVYDTTKPYNEQTSECQSYYMSVQPIDLQFDLDTFGRRKTEWYNDAVTNVQIKWTYSYMYQSEDNTCKEMTPELQAAIIWHHYTNPVTLEDMWYQSKFTHERMTAMIDFKKDLPVYGESINLLIAREPDFVYIYNNVVTDEFRALFNLFSGQIIDRREL